MTEAQKLSVITSLKVDSDDRLKNCDRFIEYWTTFFPDAELVIIEQGETARVKDRYDHPNLVYEFIKSADAHYKTRNLNFATSLSTRPSILMLDIDAFLPVAAVCEAIVLLERGMEVVFPYNGVFVNVSQARTIEPFNFNRLLNELEFFDKEFDRNKYDLSRGGFEPLFGGSSYDSMGGAIMMRRQTLVRIGGFNENIVSYGFEDIELAVRIAKLNCKAQRLSSHNCYHFDHERTIDSHYNNFYRNNESEYLRITKMEADELLRYCQNRFRNIRLDSSRELSMRNDTNEFAISGRDSGKRDMSDVAIVIAIRYFSRTSAKGFNNFLRWMEEEYNCYEITIVETTSRKFKYVDSQKNIRFFWLDHTHSVQDAAEFGRRNTKRKQVDVYEFDGETDFSVLLQTYCGGSPECVISAV